MKKIVLNGKETQYLIDVDGNVYSLKSSKFLKPQKIGDYLGVNINGKIEYIHRLVAFTYLFKEEYQTEVNHKDFNKSNNNVDNLEWVSRQENIEYSWKNEEYSKRLMKSLLENQPKLSTYPKPSYEIIKTTFDGKIIKKYNNIKEAAFFEDLSVNTLWCRINAEEYRKPCCIKYNDEYILFGINGSVVYRCNKLSEMIDFISLMEVNITIRSNFKSKLFFRDRFIKGKKTKNIQN